MSLQKKISNIRRLQRQTIWTVLQQCVAVLRVLLGNYCFFSLKKASLLQEHRCFDEISNISGVHPRHTVHKSLSDLYGLDKEMVLDDFYTQAEKEQHAKLNSSTNLHTYTHRQAVFK